MKNNIIRSTSVVGVCTGLSRVLGLFRMILMASLFGTSVYASAFFLAWTVPNMFRRLFGEGALSSAFVPVFTESIEKEGLQEANRLAGRVMSMLGSFLLVIVLLGLLLVSVYLQFVPTGEKVNAVLSLLRIMLPYLFFICMVALCMGMLNSRHHFFVPAATPVLLNVIWILVLLLVCPLFVDSKEKQIIVVAWGVLGAGIIQLLAQIPVLLKFGVKPRLDFEWRDKRIKEILILMGPAALGMGVLQINMFIGKALALAVDEWATAAIQYAELIVYLPLGLFATAMGTVLLPTLSSLVARKEKKEMLSTVNFGLRSILFVMIPASVGLVVLASSIVSLVYERGQFDLLSSIYTTRALCFFAPGLAVFGLNKVFVPAFYAHKDTKTPVVVGVWASLLNLVLMVVFILFWPVGYKHAGIAFASVVSHAFNCMVLAFLLHKKIGSPGWGTVVSTMFRVLIISCIMGLVCYFVNIWLYDLAGSIGLSLLLVRLCSVGGSIVVGFVLYSVLSVVFCREEVKGLLSSLRKSK
ncbi:murein biosynthesis integral membrane protein MurJ [Verrucomicrobiota bacterium]